MSGFFEYTCNFLDHTINDDIIKVHGVVYASSFKDAMEKLESHYGEIDNIKLTGATVSDVYEFEGDPVEFILTVKKKKERENG